MVTWGRGKGGSIRTNEKKRMKNLHDKCKYVITKIKQKSYPCEIFQFKKKDI